MDLFGFEMGTMVGATNCQWLGLVALGCEDYLDTQ